MGGRKMVNAWVLIPKIEIPKVNIDRKTLSATLKLKLRDWKVVKNNKAEFDIWNSKLKIGYYAELIRVEKGKSRTKRWFVNKYYDPNKTFTGGVLTSFKNKEEAVNFILKEIKKRIKDDMEVTSAVDFKIVPYGHKYTENAVILSCKNGIKVLVPQELYEKIAKAWEEL
jgi:hypothetical protein